MLEFINDKNPDILCIQEFCCHWFESISAQIYFNGRKSNSGQAIFLSSIIDQGNIVFPNSNNNVIYADIKKGKDIIRVYNMHLQSLKYRLT
jgi:exonuclease III